MNLESGKSSFRLVWAGQLISTLGSSMTGFGLGVWVLESTGSATSYAAIFLCLTIPTLLTGLFLGSLVDRFNRKKLILASDSVSAFCTLIFLGLYASEQLASWNIYILTAIGAVAIFLQQTAFMASVSEMLRREHIQQAAAMMQLGPASARIVAPLAAGALMPVISLQGILLLDFLTFLIALASTIAASFPDSAAGAAAPPKKSIWRDLPSGWQYLKSKPGLFHVSSYFALLNFFFGFAFVLLTPLVLSLGGTAALGTVLAFGGLGALTGSMLVIAKKVPARSLPTIFAMTYLLAASIVLIGASTFLPLVALGAFLMMSAVMIVNAKNQALLQIKVEKAYQGRVLSTSRLLAQSTAPVSYFLAGPLVDRVLQPSLEAGGWLASTLGRLTGTGAGRGTALCFLVVGALIFLSVSTAINLPRLRHAEEEIPDAI